MKKLLLVIFILSVNLIIAQDYNLSSFIREVDSLKTGNLMNEDYLSIIERGKKYAEIYKNKPLSVEYGSLLSNIAYAYSFLSDKENTELYVNSSNSVFKELGVLSNNYYVIYNSWYMYQVSLDEKWVEEGLRLIDLLNISEKEKKDVLLSFYYMISDSDYNKENWGGYYKRLLVILPLAEEIYGRYSHENIMNLRNIASSIFFQDPFSEEGLTYLLEALNLMPKVYSLPNTKYAETLFWVGFYYENKSRYLEAKDYYTSSLTHFRQLNDIYNIKRCLSACSSVWAKLGNYEEAFNLLSEKLSLSTEASKDSTDIANTLYYMADLYYSYTQDGNKALQYTNNAYNISSKIGENDLSYQILGLKARILNDMKKESETINVLLEAQDIPVSEDLIFMKALDDCWLANIYLARGEITKANHYIDSGINLFLSQDIEAAYPKAKMAFYREVATFYQESRQLNQFRLYSELAKQTVINYSGYNSEDYLELLFRESMAELYMGDKYSAIDTLSRINVIFQNNYSVLHPIAYTYFYAEILARFMCEASLDRHTIEDFMNLEKKQAKSLFFQMTETERSAFWSTHSKSKDLIFNIGFEGDYGDIMYNYALLYKGILLDASTMFGQTILSSENVNLKNKYQQLLLLKERTLKKSDNRGFGGNMINIEEGVYDDIELVEHELIQHIRETTEYNSFLNTNYSDVSKALKRGEVAVEFIDYRTIAKIKGDPEPVNYCALVLKPGESPLIVPLCSEDDLTKCLKAGMKVYNSNNYSGKQLYNLIWGPLEKIIKKGQSVYFSPSGVLYSVAIESIPVDNGKTLGDMYHLNRVSSTKVVCQPRENKQYTSLALYGGLQYDVEEDLMVSQSRKYSNSSQTHSNINVPFRGASSTGWSYLPGTKEEVDVISSLSNKFGIKSTSYFGTSGNEESFKALSGTSISAIHLATHGFYVKAEEARKVSFFDRVLSPYGVENNSDNSMKRSGLVLSGGNLAWKGLFKSDNIDDGILTAEEIANMNLGGTDLVVLSACESGLGDLSSDGIMGIQRAFKNAGVKTLIMSLWDVDDQATVLMMETFYKNLFSGKSKRNSFSEAQNEVRKKYSDPRYWAAFIMLD